MTFIHFWFVGDALFFHSNLLHTSGPNNSDLRRWAFLMAYNTKSNNPVIPHHCPQYTPLIKVTHYLQTREYLYKSGFFIKGKNVLKNDEVLFTLWLQISIYGKYFFLLQCQYTMPVIDQNHFEYPPPHSIFQSDYGRAYLYIFYWNRFQIQPSEIAPM